MSRGLSALLDSAAPTLLIAIAVLVGGVGYGFYERSQNPEQVSAVADAESTAPAAAEAAN